MNDGVNTKNKMQIKTGSFVDLNVVNIANRSQIISGLERDYPNTHLSELKLRAIGQLELKLRESLCKAVSDAYVLIKPVLLRDHVKDPELYLNTEINYLQSQVLNTFKAAVEAVQKAVNHGNENCILEVPGNIDLMLFNKLMASSSLFEVICVHRNSYQIELFGGNKNVKFSWFGGTNFTKTAQNFNDLINNEYRKLITEQKDKNRNQASKPYIFESVIEQDSDTGECHRMIRQISSPIPSPIPSLVSSPTSSLVSKNSERLVISQLNEVDIIGQRPYPLYVQLGLEMWDQAILIESEMAQQRLKSERGGAHR